jgi:ABC-type sugar transport system ATPase subunit
MSALLSMRGVQKRFGAVVALDGVDLEAHAGWSAKTAPARARS